MWVCSYFLLNLEVSQLLTESSVQDASTKKLPPNKENESNETKLAACQAWIKRLQEEDQARNARINQYKTMTERITKLTTPLPAPVPSPSDPSQMIMPDLLQPNWSLPLPRFTNKADILAYGKTLMQSKPIAISSRSTRRKSAAAAEAPSDSNTVNIQDEYPVDYDEIRHQAASLAQSSYRVNQFVKLADTFITQHLQRTQASLAQIRSGNDNRASALTSGSNEKGKNTTTTANDVNSTTQALLASAKGDARTGGAEGRKKGKDAMSLLRAISRADTGKKR